MFLATTSIAHQAVWAELTLIAVGHPLSCSQVIAGQGLPSALSQAAGTDHGTLYFTSLDQVFNAPRLLTEYPLLSFLGLQLSSISDDPRFHKLFREAVEFLKTVDLSNIVVAVTGPDIVTKTGGSTVFSDIQRGWAIQATADHDPLQVAGFATTRRLNGENPTELLVLNGNILLANPAAAILPFMHELLHLADYLRLDQMTKRGFAFPEFLAPIYVGEVPVLPNSYLQLFLEQRAYRAHRFTQEQLAIEERPGSGHASDQDIISGTLQHLFHWPEQDNPLFEFGLLEGGGLHVYRLNELSELFDQAFIEL